MGYMKFVMFACLEKNLLYHDTGLYHQETESIGSDHTPDHPMDQEAVVSAGAGVKV